MWEEIVTREVDMNQIDLDLQGAFGELVFLNDRLDMLIQLGRTLTNDVDIIGNRDEIDLVRRRMESAKIKIRDMQSLISLINEDEQVIQRPPKDVPDRKRDEVDV